MSELKAYTEEELAEHQHLYDEVFTPVWESEGQYCRAGGGQYEKSFAWWGFKHQQTKVDELQKRVDDLTELNRLKTIALQQSVNRTSPYVHEKIVALSKRSRVESNERVCDSNYLRHCTICINKVCMALV